MNMIIFICILVALVIFSAWGVNFKLATSKGGDLGSGTFGDAFGAVNSLFTGFAFLGLMIAIILQRAELSIIREERDDTRDLLKGMRPVNLLLTFILASSSMA